MSKTILVSNRLPVSVEKTEGGFSFKRSIGGLATGLSTIHNKKNSLWLGWPGITADDLSNKDKKLIDEQLVAKYKCKAVHLDSEEFKYFYEDFCNDTIWPLFHYFPNRTNYNEKSWSYFKKINERFFLNLKKILKKGDIVWIHDYQLMLLPALIKEAFPAVYVGYFHHIPFPSFEIFRLLPWRQEILEGLLGSDLLGFHTYDYMRHFISSVRRLLGIDGHLGNLQVENRYVKVDVFPMGIDYEKYNKSSVARVESKEITELKKSKGNRKIVMSVDRLDYTKGIIGRIRAISHFLEGNPKYHGKVNFMLIIAPSRTSVSQYQELLREIEETISHINGKYGKIGWTPIWFFYRSFDFNDLTALYNVSDVLLLTPLRDGMNLVAKEYIAANRKKEGVLILSETAGAASELGEALIVNSNNYHEISQAICTALRMPKKEQIRRNEIMQDRLRKYTVEKWAEDFIHKLKEFSANGDDFHSVPVTKKVLKGMLSKYHKTKKRLILLDYDGTLRAFTDTPEKAVPGPKLLELLRNLALDKRNTVVIISGRDKKVLGNWFGKLPINLIAAHGTMYRLVGKKWQMLEFLTNDWKEDVRTVFESYVLKTPKSFIEEKQYSLAMHYRNCDPGLAELRISELKEALMNMTSNLNLGLLDGHKVLEVKDMTVSKGRTASRLLLNQDWDFIFSAGDDITDEDLFEVLPKKAFSVKVGKDHSAASFYVNDNRGVINILEHFVADK